MFQITGAFAEFERSDLAQALAGRGSFVNVSNGKKSPEGDGLQGRSLRLSGLQTTSASRPLSARSATPHWLPMSRLLAWDTGAGAFERLRVGDHEER